MGGSRSIVKRKHQLCTRKGANRIYLHSTDKMSEAIRLYKWLGFKRDRSKEFCKLDFLVKCYRLDI